MKITPKQYASAWYNALQESPEKEWDTLSNKFLALIRESGDMKSLHEISQLMSQHETKEQGLQRVTVKMAHDTDTDWVKTQVQQLVPNAHPDVTVTMDSSIVGGAQIETDNDRWDVSLHGQLRQLQKHLTN